MPGDPFRRCTMSATHCAGLNLNPKVRSRVAVRHVDIKQIGIAYLGKHFGQFLRAMLCAKCLPPAHSDTVCLVKIGDLLAREPQPASGAGASFTVAKRLLDS